MSSLRQGYNLGSASGLFLPMSKVAVFGAKSGSLTYLHGFTRAIFDTATAAAKRLGEENSILNPRSGEIAIPCGTIFQIC
jgi:hypothetical protein